MDNQVAIAAVAAPFLTLTTAALLATVKWLWELRQTSKSIDAKLDALNGTLADHVGDHTARGGYNERIAWLEGQTGQPLGSSRQPEDLRR